eukprot:CAMPEP_0119060460 /NCGR_PEP_ID=MMETSP1178-20130426/4414_1 /TAXON_ID=33656 /ORGANISM="unid sp, Strain CCMP2000" /LENGTH=95 /DNA_ID=CAMNT_0007041559 /DNA_START=252 /DNA_END=536 /DNA_ORIENTATION=+
MGGAVSDPPLVVEWILMQQPQLLRAARQPRTVEGQASIIGATRDSTATTREISLPSHNRRSGLSALMPSGGDSESMAKPDSTTHAGSPCPLLESR